MAGVVFSKLSGKNDSLYKAVEGVMTEIITDADKEKSKHDEVLNAICSVRSSKKFGERVGGLTQLGNFKPMGEGQVFAKDEIEEGYAKLAVHASFGSQFTVTHEMAEDNELDDAKIAAQGLVDSYKRTKLQFTTDFLKATGTTFNFNGKTFDRTTGDGKAYFATDHLIKADSRQQSNVYTNAFGTTDDILNKLAVIGRNFTNDSGNVMGLTFDTIVIPGNCATLEKTIKAVIASNQVVGSDYNDVNTQKGRWTLVVDHLWTAASGKNPYILLASEANKRFGAFRFYNREALSVRNWIDEPTRNLEWSGYCRFSILPYLWQGMIMGGADSGTTL